MPLVLMKFGIMTFVLLAFDLMPFVLTTLGLMTFNLLTFFHFKVVLVHLVLGGGFGTEVSNF
jgi:hypothetical protein